MTPCTEKCRAPVVCMRCHLRKKPIGRDAGAAQANSLCDYECPGYYEEPRPPHLWPNEDLTQAEPREA